MASAIKSRVCWDPCGSRAWEPTKSLPKVVKHSVRTLLWYHNRCLDTWLDAFAICRSSIYASQGYQMESNYIALDLNSSGFEGFVPGGLLNSAVSPKRRSSCMDPW